MTLIPLHNAHLSAARGMDGKIVGLELRQLFTHEQLPELPEPVLTHARAVIACAVEKDRAA